MCCLPALVPVIEMAAQMQGHDGVDAAQWIYFKIDEITTETSLVSWARHRSAQQGGLRP